MARPVFPGGKVNDFRLRIRALSGALVLGVAVTSLGGSPAAAAAAQEEWLTYRPSLGCPGRDVVERELLSRMAYRPNAAPRSVAVSVVFDDGAYLGTVNVQGSSDTVGRQVRHESCEQLIHALSLVAALMLDGASAEPAAVPSEAPMATNAATASRPPSVASEPSVVVTPNSPNKKPTKALKRSISSFSVGPWLAATSDGLATPHLVQLGMRGGAVLTFHGAWPRHQQALRLSAARVASGDIEHSTGTAHITWTSVRMDLCDGWSAHQLSTVGGCGVIDVGRLTGSGSTDGSNWTHRSAYWARAGIAIAARQVIVDGLALSMDLGLVASFARPGFYFGPVSDTAGSEQIHRARRLGPIADLGLELHFW